MSDIKTEIMTAALSLPIEARQELVHALNDSVTGASREIEEAWYDEAEHRLAAFEAGLIDALPGERVMAEARVRDGLGTASS